MMTTITASDVSPHDNRTLANAAATAGGNKGVPADQGVATDVVDARRLVRDTVSISPQALALTAAQPKTFGQVTEDARASIDRVYADLAAQGKPFDHSHARQEDWEGLTKGLDRRSLFAVASNSGGMFSADEQAMAQGLMGRQESGAMGLNGPMGSVSMMRDPAPGFAAGIRFLDGVSEEEKQSMEWKVGRASMQWMYESTFDQRHLGEKKENFTIEDPIVKMLVAAFHSMEHKAPRSMVSGLYVKDLEDLKRMPLFDNGFFAQERDQAIAEYHKLQRA